MTAPVLMPVATALLLAACASTGPAPVEDLSLGASRHAASVPRGESNAAAVQRAGERYRVQRGDTLYSIAFRRGLDYRTLAAWNHIADPYTIYVGQELVLGAAPRAAGAVATSPASTARATAAAAPAPTATRKMAAAAVPAPPPFQTVTAQSASASTANEAAPSGAQVPAHVPAPAAPPVGPAAVDAARAAAPDTPVSGGEIAWRWPADGPVTGSYVGGDQTRQGIDIAGKSGDPVRAAADGTVVYSGNGLIGYGELIIVKHSPAYLSAYGHNRKRLVKEGDRVRAGQTIAEMGSSSASRDSLHFEIRKNGKPVNPADYLPRR